MIYHLNAAERIAAFRKKVDEDFNTRASKTYAD